MAVRVTELVVEVLRSTALGSNVPVSAGNIVTFADIGHGGRDLPKSAVESFALADLGGGARDCFGHGETLILLTYIAGQTRDAGAAAGNAFLFYDAARLALDLILTAGTTLTIAADGGAIRDILAATESAITLDFHAVEAADFPADAAATFAVATIGTAPADRPAAGSATLVFTDQGDKRGDFTLFAVTSLDIDQGILALRDVHADALSFVDFGDDVAGLRDVNALAMTTVNLADQADEIRDAVLFGVTTLGMRYLGGARPPEVFIRSGFDLDAEAGATVDRLASASNRVTLAPLPAAWRGIAVKSSSVVVVGRLAHGSRAVFGTATTIVAIEGIGQGTREASCSASSALLIDGWNGHAAKDIYPAATTAIDLGHAGAAERAANVNAATTVRLTIDFQGIRTLHLRAMTRMTLRQTYQDADNNIVMDVRAVNQALGGNPVASTYIGYLGQFQQGQTVTLMLRTMGYQGRIVVPDAAPVANIYADDATNGPLMTLRIPATDKDSGLFALPLFVGRQLPLGRYRVAYRYTAAGQTWARLDTFEVIPGGDPGGAVISMFAYDRPESGYVLAQLGGGKLVQGRNPRL